MVEMFPHRIACAAWLTLAVPATAAAQVVYPQGGYSQPAPPAGAAATPVCGRLEAQLAAIDRGVSADPARAEQTRRFEETLNKQQAELDRTRAERQRLRGQPPSPVSIFANQSPRCGPRTRPIGQIRAGIARPTADPRRLRHR